MTYEISENDKRLILQNIINIRVKIEVFDINKRKVDEIECGLIGGSSSISAESDIRRTFNVEVLPLDKYRYRIAQDGIVWIDKSIKLYIGIYSNRLREYVWYPQGEYVFTNTSATYDAASNKLTLNCSDMMTTLDGSKNGQLGQLEIKYPAYEEDENGNVVKYNYINEAIITTLTQLARIKDYAINDIGEYKAMPQYNTDYEEYRKRSRVQVKSGEFEEIWNALPYDLEFSSGDTILNILTTFRDLYPQYEMFFDVYGTFVCQMIPSCRYDYITLGNDFIQKILISESTNINLLSVRNMVEVWGKSFEPTFFAEEDITYSNGCYNVPFEEYGEEYMKGDLVCFKSPVTNTGDITKMKVNELSEVEIYDENTEQPIKAGMLEKDRYYCFKFINRYIDEKIVPRWYLLGQWQAHGMYVLTDGTVGDEYTTTGGDTVKRYSKEYFQKVYNCDYVEFDVIPDSPFTVQALQKEILDVKTGGEFDKISSSSLALARAQWELYKDARLTDSISITTKILPFLDVNQKIEYKRSDSDEAYQYIVKSINHDWSAGTTSIEMIRFYDFYIPSLYHDELEKGE